MFRYRLFLAVLALAAALPLAGCANRRCCREPAPAYYVAPAPACPAPVAAPCP